MLTLNDGRAELWQWDTGRTLAVDADCSQVHFSNKVFGRSIDVDVADGVAIIPDVLLQTDRDLSVWAFVGTAENGYTKISKTFKVNRRNKPADYVFTPADQITLQTIQSQIGDLADLTTEAKDTLVAAINEAARTGAGGGGSTVELDTTLTQSGKAADAAAVGEQISSLSGKIVTDVAEHNTGTDAHSDIRMLISGLTDRLNALADSDDTTLDQLSEVVAYIKSNRTLIEAITTSKVSVSDIIDNLVTNVANKPLSAAQGVALKALIDSISVPDKLPNPNALTFTGAVTGSYDGSAPLNVEIPIGGGSGNASYEDTVIVDITIEEEVQTYRTSVLSSEAVNALENADFIFFCANLKPPTEQTDRGKLLASIYGAYYHATKFFYDDAAYAKVTPSSAADGENIAESIGVVNKANPGKSMFQTVKWKNTDNKYGGEVNASSRASIIIPKGSVFNISTSGVFGVGTTVKLVARRLV